MSRHFPRQEYHPLSGLCSVMAGECCLVFVEISLALVRHQRVDESTDSDPREWRTLLTYLTLDLVPIAISDITD